MHPAFGDEVSGIFNTISTLNQLLDLSPFFKFIEKFIDILTGLPHIEGMDPNDHSQREAFSIGIEKASSHHSLGQGTDEELGCPFALCQSKSVFDRSRIELDHFFKSQRKVLGLIRFPKPCLLRQKRED